MRSHNIPLFCLPYAGASAMVYNRWRRPLQPGIEVRPVEIPGRGRRLAEALPRDIVELARQLVVEHRQEFAAPYGLFGHSLGALVAFEMAHVIQDLGLPAPLALFVSGAEAPSERDTEWYANLDTDAELTQKLLELDGTPAEALSNDELMRMTLPIVRADFRMCARYRHDVRDGLDCPLRVFAGRQDRPSVSALRAWQKETLRSAELTLFDGGHFFLHEREAAVHDQIRNALSGPVPAVAETAGARADLT